MHDFAPPVSTGQGCDGPRLFLRASDPDLVWRPEWLFRGLFGGDAIAEREGRWVIAAGSAQVELALPNMIAADG